MMLSYSQLLVNERSLDLTLDARRLSLQGDAPLEGAGNGVEETAVDCVVSLSWLGDSERLLDATALFILEASRVKV